MLILIKCINIKLYRSLRVLDVDINDRFNRLSVLATHAKKKRKKKESIIKSKVVFLKSKMKI